LGAYNLVSLESGYWNSFESIQQVGFAAGQLIHKKLQREGAESQRKDIKNPGVLAALLTCACCTAQAGNGLASCAMQIIPAQQKMPVKITGISVCYKL
jgi:hypothetical protein